MHMLKNLTAPARIEIADLPPTDRNAPKVRELQPDQLNLVVGCRPSDTDSGYMCTATGGGPSEDCWRE